MVFYKLNAKHKFYYILSKLIIFIGLLIAFILAQKNTNIPLPNKESRLSATLGYVMISIVFGLAFINRINIIFKIKSLGFIILFLLFYGLEYIIVPVRVATSYMLVPLLLDDLIVKQIWLNIWYNHYDGLVKIQ